MHCLAPPGHAPALLAPCSSLLQVGELPEVVNHVQVAVIERLVRLAAEKRVSRVLPDLHEPSANTFHDLSACRKALLPVCLPLE